MKPLGSAQAMAAKAASSLWGARETSESSAAHAVGDALRKPSADAAWHA